MKLFYNPRSRATIAKWMLDECGAAYEIIPVDLERREHKAPEYLEVNPSGFMANEARAKVSSALPAQPSP